MYSNDIYIAILVRRFRFSYCPSFVMLNERIIIYN